MLRGWLARGAGAPTPAAAAAGSLACCPRVHTQLRQLSSARGPGSGAAPLLPCGGGDGRVLAVPQLRPRSSSMVCLAGLEVGQLYKSTTAAAHKSVTSFEQLGLAPPLLEALAAANFHKPTEIQAMAVPAILSGGDYLLASQTGSGKTLAYLLPLVQLMKAQEAADAAAADAAAADAAAGAADAAAAAAAAAPRRRPKRPRIVVLGPTKELTEQITAVAKSLCHFAKFRPVCCNANSSEAAQAKRLAAPVDVVVATPTRLLQHMAASNLALGDVQWLVIDEADTMFDQGFGEEVGKVLQALKAKAPPAQVVLVSATMTKAVKRLATAQLPELRRLEASGFHKPTAGARQDFRVLPPGGDKMSMLLELLSGASAARRKVLVFCGSVASCRAVEHTCQDRGLQTVCYHGDMPVPARKEAMAVFAGAAADDEGGDRSERAPIMVASDLAARGLDFPGTIDHVINFDFPSNAIDYLHRAGRTARAGATGRVTSLVGPRDRKLANAIVYALDKGLPLDQVTASGAVAAPQPQQERRSAQSTRGARQQAPAKGAKQAAVQWNPQHKFLHISAKDGSPLVPFKTLLKGATGDERRRLLYEIALDTKEWQRRRRAKSVQRTAKRREQEDAALARGRSGASGPGRAGRPPADAEERWKARRAQQGHKHALREGGGGGGGSGRRSGATAPSKGRGQRGASRR